MTEAKKLADELMEADKYSSALGLDENAVTRVFTKQERDLIVAAHRI